MMRKTMLAAIAFLAGAFPAAGRPAIPAPRDAHDAMDQKTIAQLRKAGANLTKRTDVVHYLYIPVRQDADSAAQQAAAAGYRATVQPPLGRLPNGTVENRYSVVAHADVVPSLANVRKARAFFEALARRYGGEYDGWEAAVTK